MVLVPVAQDNLTTDTYQNKNSINRPQI